MNNLVRLNNYYSKTIYLRLIPKQSKNRFSKQGSIANLHIKFVKWLNIIKYIIYSKLLESKKKKQTNPPPIVLPISSAYGSRNLNTPTFCSVTFFLAFFPIALRIFDYISFW